MTEKDYNPKQKEMKAMGQQPKEEIKQKLETPVKKEDKKTEAEEKKKETEKKETKKPSKKVKKEEVTVNGRNVHVSTKYAIAICKFIKKKRIGDAIRDLEQVAQMKKSVPMKGEYAHRKGKGKFASGSGKYPLAASKHFIVLLKSLAGNANNHEIDEPVISEAVANFAARPLGRFGRVKRKRTHLKLVAREMKVKETKKKIEEVKK